jgi:hypothetical protein
VPKQVLIPAAVKAKLLENGRASAEARGGSVDHVPVVKFFLPEGSATWLITEMDPENPDILFGLCDPGLGEPELGSVSLTELESVRGKRYGLPIERDEHIRFDKPISAYARKARSAGQIVTSF